MPQLISDSNSESDGGDSESDAPPSTPQAAGMCAGFFNQSTSQPAGQPRPRVARAQADAAPADKASFIGVSVCTQE
jgi:hypothetical protein